MAIVVQCWGGGGVPDGRASVAIGAAVLVVASLAGYARLAGAGSGILGRPGGVRVAAAASCADEASCLPSLRELYGADLTDALVPVDGPAEALAAVRDGTAQVAAVPAGTPGAAGTGLHVLTEGDGPPASHRPVPAYRREAGWLHPALAADLDAVSAALDDGAVAALSRGGDTADGPDVTFVAADRSGPPIVVAGSTMASLYAGQLTKAGYAVDLHDPFPTTAAALDALADGTVGLVVDEPADLVAELAGQPSAGTGPVGAVIGRLRGYLGQIGALAAAPARTPGTWFVTTVDLAGTLDLVTVEDLAAYGRPSPEPAGGQAAAPDGAPAAAVAPDLRLRDDVLGWDDTGPEVTGLQQLLALVGDPVEATGVYGAATVDAVRRFQAANGIPADGAAGPSTVARLAEVRRAEAAPDVAVPPADRVVYLTFDDGPDPAWTPQVLDVLARHGARATFFVVGSAVANAPELARRTGSEGHALANHTYHHVALDTASPATVTEELGRTSVAVESATGRWPACMRAPFDRLSATASEVATSAGYRVVGWDLDTLDWQRPGAGTIAATAVEGATPGAVILFHDGGGDRSETVAALDRVLTDLAADGYRFEPVPGC
jgi:peptidoglycan-N-acetylglucosamine deacetylase